MGKHKQETIDLVMELYLQGMKEDKIAEMQGIPLRTIYNWKTRYNWGKNQTSSIILAAKIRLKMREMTEAAIDDNSFETAEFADKMSKLQKIADRLNPEGQLLGNVYAFIEATTEVIAKTADQGFIDKWKKSIPDIADFIKQRYQR